MKKILIIDDTAPLLEEISDLLKMEGYNVITAADGAEGMEKIIKSYPDLIITDILMPKMDGFELISRTRTLKERQYIPIIVLSAQAAKETEERVKELKADAYIRKPCSADDLLLAIDNILN